jgi:UDP-N-acetylmuramoyl-tripeptide--D-alanyl-D-alanine ligase
VHRTAGNYNNLIGLPLTVLGLEKSHEVAVLEMGMNRSGEIRRLAQIARPDVGVVTNIGPVHLEHLGGVEGVAAAKGELVEELGPDAAAVLNADDPRTAALSKSVRGQVLTFGIVRFADFRAGKITAAADGTTFSLTSPLGKADVSIAFPGEHNVLNALAAAAAGAALGAGLDDIVEGLSAARPVPMRFTVLSYRDGITVVNDAYNANPESARAALRSLGLIEGRGRRAAVLGDMLELGEESAAAHHALGGEAATSIDFMIAVGAFAGETAAGAVAAGLGEEMVRIVPSRREAADILKEWIRPGDIVLLKGSRGAALEEVLRLLESAGALEEI